MQTVAACRRSLPGRLSDAVAAFHVLEQQTSTPDVPSLVRLVMANLQAVLDFSVELHKFINVDLFQRGYYQVRINHKVSSKIMHKIEVNYSRLGKDAGSGSHMRGSIVFPPCIVNGAAVSKTFQILYKNEEVELNDVLCCKIHLVLDASRCIDQVRRVKFLLDVELWYTDQDFGPEHHSSIECVSSRQLLLHVDMCRGIHCHVPVIFDYFHLSAVTVSIHASLVTLCQPYLTPHRVKARTAWSADQDLHNDMSGYDHLLFGCPLSLLNDLEKEEVQLRMRRAQLVHWQLCSLIFTSSQSVERKIDEYKSLPGRHHGHRHHSHHHTRHQTEVKPSSKSMSVLAQACYKSFSDASSDKSKDFAAHQKQSFASDIPSDVRPGDYITLVESDLAYLSGLSILQWEQFLKLVVHSDRIAHHLAKIHHSQRIKRFAEAFFVIERPRSSIMSLCDQSSLLFSDICDSLRKSHYFHLLPACDVECLSLDGDAASLPVIFEETYDPLSPDTTSGLEQPLANLLSDSLPPAARSLREKLMTRLALNSPARGFVSGRSSASFCDRRGGEEAHTSSWTRSRSQTRSEMRSTVTMTDLQALSGGKENALLLSDLSPGKKDIATAAKITPQQKSDSLPDLSVLNSFAKFKSKRSPAILPHKKSLTIQNNKDLISEIFEGTTYFPKPPPEFGQPVSGKETDMHSTYNVTDAKPAETNSVMVNGSSDLGNRKNLVEQSPPQTQPSPHKCTKCNTSETSCNCIALDASELTREQQEERHRKRSAVSSSLISFLEAKEDFRNEKMKGWNIYSDFPQLASKTPYFQSDEDLRSLSFPSSRGLHLIVCVHGLDGNSADLRLIKTYLELGLPASNFEFLMSQRNQGETFECFETLRDRLVNEIIYHIEVFRLNPTRIRGSTVYNIWQQEERCVSLCCAAAANAPAVRLDFIGHSLGTIIIRGALSQPLMKPWLSKLHTFLSLSGPHLGTAYNSSGLVNMGLWVFQKWKKSASLLQLSMRDNVDPRQCYLYKLSQEPGLEYFQNILLCGSTQDNYVPLHSAHIELCTAAVSDTSVYGSAYREMASHLLQPIMKKSCQLVRFDVHHALNSNANSLIGRAAHIAVLDSELFIEKFMVVCGLKYFV